MSYQEVCRFVSNKGHPSFPEIIKDAKDVFETKVNDGKVNLVSKTAFYVQIAQCVLSLTLHSILNLFIKNIYNTDFCRIPKIE